MFCFDKIKKIVSFRFVFDTVNVFEYFKIKGNFGRKTFHFEKCQNKTFQIFQNFF